MIIQLIIIQVITFVIIVVFLKKLLYTETAKESDRLKKLREEFSQKEKELKARIDEAGKDAEGKLAKAAEDARKYRDAKEKEAEEQKESILAKAREMAEGMVKNAVNSKQKIREEIEIEVREKIPAAAVQIFKEAMPPAAVEFIHSELVAELIGKVKKMEKNMFSRNTDKGDMVSAYPVKRAEKTKIVTAISDRAGRDIVLTEKEDRSLGAGVVIKLGALIIDGSLENKLKQAGRRLG